MKSGDGHTQDETLQARIERFSRERPPAFANGLTEILFVFSIVMSQFMTEFFVSGFPVILPTIIKELDIPQASSVWPASAFSLVIASTLLIFGRLADIWGGAMIYLAGLTWLIIWSVITGFSTSPIMLILCRAVQGFGSAAALPAGIMLMGSVYRPGPRKNLVFSLYGMAGVLGFFGGILFAGIAGQFTRWGFYFWIGAMLTAISLLTSLMSVRSVTTPRPAARPSVDFLGAVSIVTGLTLTIFAITQSAHAPDGWRTPYIPVCLAVGLISLVLAFYIEGYFAKDPLLPRSIFEKPSMKPLCLVLLLLYGNWAIFSVYGTLYFQDIMGASPMQVVAWYIPLGVVGLVGSILEGVILHLVSGRVLLIVSGVAALGSQLLLALMPLDEQSYWPFVFPSTILGTIGIDIATILMTVFVTTVIPLSQQGVAGSVINSVFQLGVAFSLGATDIIQVATVDRVGVATSYKYTFWFGTAAGALSLIILAIFVHIPKASADLTADEKAELPREEVTARDEAVDRTAILQDQPLDVRVK